MATLILPYTFINLMASGEYVAAYTAIGRGTTSSIEGRVDTFGGGRQRAISVEGERTSMPFTLVEVPPADVDTLISWKGLTVCARDNRGRRIFGVFFEVNPEEARVRDFYDVPLTVIGVSTPEGV